MPRTPPIPNETRSVELPRGGPLGRTMHLLSPDDEDRWQVNLQWVRAFLLAHFAIRSFLTIPVPFAGAFAWAFGGDAASPVPLGYEALLWASVLTGLAGQNQRWASVACRLAVVCVCAQIIVPFTPTSFPLTANHLWLELMLLGVVSFLDLRKEDEANLLLTTMRWMVVMLIFYSGVQKLLYGTYFDGQFFAYQISTEDRFADVFRFLVPAEEFDRIRALNLRTEGAGPYRVDSVLFAVVSNAVYLFEMAIPFLLIWRRTRKVATLACIVFMIMVELGAREFTFGILMVNLLLLFLPRPWNKWLFPVSLALYLPLIAQHVGLLSMDWFYYAPA